MSIARHAKLYRNYPLPAGPSPWPLNLSGRHFMLISSPVPIGVKLGELPENDLVSGQALALDAPDEFDRVELRNSSDQTIRIDFWLGHIAFRDDRRDNLESPTVCVGWSGTQIEATTQVRFDPQLIKQRIRRKSIIVSNRDPALNLEITDTDNNIVSRVGPEQTITLPISESYIVRNDNGTDVACNIGEIYWLR